MMTTLGYVGLRDIRMGESNSTSASIVLENICLCVLDPSCVKRWHTKAAMVVFEEKRLPFCIHKLYCLVTIRFEDIETRLCRTKCLGCILEVSLGSGIRPSKETRHPLCPPFVLF